MELRRVAVLVAVGVLAVFPPVVSGQVYKWVDEQGVVNYSQTPPKGARTTLLEDSGRVTVVPAPPKPPVGTGQTALENRVDRLERDLQDDRFRAQQLKTSREQQLQAWRERCRNEKWADCDDERALVARYNTDPRWGRGGSYPPFGLQPIPPVARPRPPIIVTPAPPPAPAPSPSAPAARLGSGGMSAGGLPPAGVKPQTSP